MAGRPFENLTGDATITVWQRLSERNAFVVDLAVRAALLMGVLLLPWHWWSGLGSNMACVL